MKKNVQNLLSPSLQLIRFDKPIGSLLLLWPTVTALWMANQGMPSFKLLFIFGAGVFCMRSAGCIVNDLADQKFDRHVKRTQGRPLVSGRMHPKSALKLLVVFLATSFVLVLMTNTATITLSVIALALAVIYPFCKRFTQLPQYVLGTAFAMAIPMAYTASNEPMSTSCWLLFLATVLWAVAYDTIYAMVDKKDDVMIGVKSTAILFGRYDKLIVLLHHGCVLALYAWLLFRHGALMDSWILWMAGACSVAYQQWLIKQRIGSQCFAAFLHNHWFGLCMFLSVLFMFLSIHP